MLLLHGSLLTVMDAWEIGQVMPTTDVWVARLDHLIQHDSTGMHHAHLFWDVKPIILTDSQMCIHMHVPKYASMSYPKNVVPFCPHDNQPVQKVQELPLPPVVIPGLMMYWGRDRPFWALLATCICQLQSP